MFFFSKSILKINKCDDCVLPIMNKSMVHLGQIGTGGPEDRVQLEPLVVINVVDTSSATPFNIHMLYNVAAALFIQCT